MKPAPLLWLDLETTGLALDDQIIEVAACITSPDAPFERLDSDPFRMLCPPAAPYTVGDVVLDMHVANGLWAELRHTSATIAQVERELVAYIGRTVHGSKVTLAGAGVASFDQRMIAKWMPKVAARMTYYTFDVSVVRRWHAACGHAVPDDDGGHRAWPDVVQALDMARGMASRGAASGLYVCATCLAKIEGPMVSIPGTTRVIHYPECPSVDDAAG